MAKGISIDIDPETIITSKTIFFAYLDSKHWWGRGCTKYLYSHHSTTANILSGVDRIFQVRDVYKVQILLDSYKCGHRLRTC